MKKLILMAFACFMSASLLVGCLLFFSFEYLKFMGMIESYKEGLEMLSKGFPKAA